MRTLSLQRREMDNCVSCSEKPCRKARVVGSCATRNRQSIDTMRSPVQMALLAAMKFHCAVVALGRSPLKHWSFILSLVKQAVRYLQHLIRTRMASAKTR